MRRWWAGLLMAGLVTACGSVPPQGGPAATPTTSSTAAAPPATATTATTAALPATTTPTATRSSTRSGSPTPARSTDAKPLAGRTIVVDPGHNGVWTRAQNRPVPAGNGRTKACNTSGTAGGDYPEHAFTWSLAGEVAHRLRALGGTVVLTRSNDHSMGPCVNIRAKITNDADADLLVSLHADGNLARGARGYHIIVSSTMIGGAGVERRSVALARELRAAMDAGTTMPRSTYVGAGTAIHARTDVAGLNLIRVPGVMMEMGNMRNATDLALLQSPGFRRAAAAAIADGVIAALR